MAQERTMIQVENLSKHYGPKHAVDNISFEVNSGEVLGFIGPNGAGKSTTMKMLTCYLAPTAGVARVGGYDVRESSLDVRRLVGYLPENTPLYQDMVVLDFLEFISSVRQVDLSRRRSRIREIVEICNLSDVLTQPVGELSKGYRQRAGLAQAMIHDPPILILDEPTSGLDPNQIYEFRQVMKEIGKEKTIILSTHILSEVEVTCGRVIVIADGKLVADGSPEELARGTHENEYIVVLGWRQDSPPVSSDVDVLLGKLRGMPWVTRVVKHDITVEQDNSQLWFKVSGLKDKDLLDEMRAFVTDGGWKLLAYRHEEASLEQAFRKLTWNSSRPVPGQPASDQAK